MANSDILEQHKLKLHSHRLNSGKVTAIPFIISVFLSDIWKHKQNTNFLCCFVWVQNVVCHIQGGTQAGYS